MTHETKSSTGAACTICTTWQVVPHYHHTVPRSRGGENSLQIPLCGGCHTTLHAHALWIVAKVRNSKLPSKQFWASDEVENRAKKWLQILVSALSLPIAPGYVAQHPLNLSVNTEFLERIRLLQQDLGVSSMEKTIRYALEKLITERGLANVSTSTQKPRSDLWFMHRPS